MRTVTAAFVVFLGFALIFSGQISFTEAVSDVGEAAVVTALLAALPRSRRFDLKGPWFTIVGAPLSALGSDAWRVGRVLARAVRTRPAGQVGSIRQRAFRSGTASPADAGRRALVTLSTSVAPNGYVIRDPAGSDMLVLHQLTPSPSARNPEWPL